VFVIHFRPDRSCSDPIKSLRWILKKAQPLGLKCVSAIEEKEDGGRPAEKQISREEPDNRQQ
jgi:hypothetical protein